MTELRHTIQRALLASLFCAPVVGFAQTNDTNSGPPRLIWTQPTEGARIVGRQFTLKFVIAGDPTGPLSTVDHVHYNVAPLGLASAAPGKFTTRGLTGIEDVNIDLLLGASATPGIYEACTYMATVVHTRITQPNCVSFHLVFSGINIDSPTEAETLPSYSGNQVAYSLFGEPGITVVRYQLDAGVPQTDSSGQGLLTLPSLSEGEHTIVVWGEDSSSQLVGEKAQVTFSVRPRLSYLAVQNVANAAAQSLVVAPALRQATLAVVYDSIVAMTLGGSKDRNPNYPRLSTKSSKKLLSSFRSAYAHAGSRRFGGYAKKLRDLARAMLRP